MASETVNKMQPLDRSQHTQTVAAGVESLLLAELGGSDMR